MLKLDLASIVSVVGAIAFQLWVTSRVRRSRIYKPAEKRSQLRLIWMLPIVGASLSLAMLASDHDHPPRDDSSSAG